MSNIFNKQVLQQIAHDGRVYPELAKRMAAELLADIDNSVTNTNEKQLTEPEKQQANKLATALYTAFIWNHTPQGQDYWQDVYENLLRISS